MFFGWHDSVFVILLVVFLDCARILASRLLAFRRTPKPTLHPSAGHGNSTLSPLCLQPLRITLFVPHSWYQIPWSFTLHSFDLGTVTLVSWSSLCVPLSSCFSVLFSFRASGLSMLLSSFPPSCCMLRSYVFGPLVWWLVHLVTKMGSCRSSLFDWTTQ